MLVLLLASFSILGPIQTNAQTASRHNVLSQSITSHPIPAGPSVRGIFEGRPPCQEIARQLQFRVGPECTKIKWRLILFQDPVTRQPTAYKLLGNFLPPEGKWKLVKGTRSDPQAEVIQLNPDKPAKSFYFLKGDDNVLFILDENRELRVGNENFSFTLNRVQLVKK